MKHTTLFDFAKKAASELDSGETGILKTVDAKKFLSKQNPVYSDDIIKFLYKTENQLNNNTSLKDMESENIEACIDQIINEYDYTTFSTRLDDYKLAIDSTKTVEYAKRAHFVLKSEILSPDATDKKTLIVKKSPNSDLGEDDIKRFEDDFQRK